jgi:surface protein
LSDNYIIGTLKINQINQPERIINGNVNADVVDIYFNDVKIDFNKVVQFQETGEYTVKYVFKQSISDMDRLFYQCNSLVALDLSHFDGSNVVNMDSTFRESKNLEVVDLTNFDATRVTYMGGLFKDCSNLIALDLSTFRTSNALKDTRNMFESCTSLLSIDFRNFDTQGVTTMMYMFINCPLL